MAPVDDDEFLDFFSCGICHDYFCEPVTIKCCGKSFCCRCLRMWIKSSVRSAGIPRCPAGCNRKIPFELPAPSSSLIGLMEKLVPDELERRKDEDAEQAQEEEEQTCNGGFKSWEQVAAASDINFGNLLCVCQGTPGIVIGNSSDDNFVTVKFERREDDSELCVDVLPGHLMKPLPGNFRLGQKVMACADLHLNDAIIVRLGCAGTIIGEPKGAVDHLLVSFEERLDGVDGYIAVDSAMLLPDQLLVGGYKLGQKVLSNADLVVNGQSLVPIDTPGKVIAEYSDTRLTVAFDVGESNQNQENYDSHCIFNVQPVEIRAFSDSPCDIRPGQIVCAKFDLGTHGNVLVPAGTRGMVQSCIDDKRIVVAFEGNEEHGTSPQILTLDESSLEKASKNAEEDAKRAVEATP